MGVLPIENAVRSLVGTEADLVDAAYHDAVPWTSWHPSAVRLASGEPPTDGDTDADADGDAGGCGCRIGGEAEGSTLVRLLALHL